MISLFLSSLPLLFLLKQCAALGYTFILSMPDNISYSSRFQDQTAVDAYEHQEYGTGAYSSFAWQWQRPVVEKVIQEFQRSRNAPARLLDFACGTGRVLSCVESLVDAAEGIDISENMVALARGKCRKARFKVGNIISQPGLLEGRYDVVTAFRFLLNVEPSVRQQVLRKLREVITAPGGLLLINVHGNSRSLRHPAIVWRRWWERSRRSGAMLNEMSPDETKSLLHTSGFRIVRQFGFGLLPPTLYRTPLRRPVAALDRKFAGENLWRDLSIDMMFVCEPC
jgi:ubiquinone/menaquinone biosynthesis C-methylase UbiE